MGVATLESATPGAFTPGSARLATQPPLSALVDSLQTGTISPTLWPVTFGTIASTSAGFVCTQAAHDTVYDGVNSGQYSLAGSQMTVKLPNAGNQSLVSWEIYIQCFTDAYNWVGFYINQGTIKMWSTQSDSTTTVHSLTYVPGTHVWFRISESNGTTSWDISADGVTWGMNLQTAPDPIDLSSVDVQLMAGTYNSEASGTSATFADFNVMPVFSADASVGLDGSSIAASLSSSDLESAVEAGHIGVSSADLEFAVDSGSVAVAVSSSDLESAIEGARLGVSSADLESAVDGSSIAASLSSSDLESAVEAGHIGVSSSDLSVAIEGASTSVPVSSSDVMTGVDGGVPPPATLSSADVEASVDSGRVAAALSSSDLEVSVDGGSVHVTLSSADVEVSFDAGSISSVALLSSDVLHGTEGSSIAAALSDSDLEVAYEMGSLPYIPNPARLAVIAVADRDFVVSKPDRTDVIMQPFRDYPVPKPDRTDTVQPVDRVIVT